MSFERVTIEPSTQDGCAVLSADDMMQQATAAAAFLKALAHEGRLMILCHLQSGEKSVTELEHLLSSRQAAVSQQLARLRMEGLVNCRRDGKVIYYSIQDPKVETAIGMVYEMFCKSAQSAAAQSAAGQSAAGQSAAGQSAAGQSAAGQSAAGQSSAGQSST